MHTNCAVRFLLVQAETGTWLIKEDGTTTYNGKSYGPDYEMTTNDKGLQGAGAGLVFPGT